MAREQDRKNRKRKDEDEDAKPVDVESELEELEGAWDEAEDKGDSFGDIPDDKYQSKVSGARIVKSQSSGRMQIAWEFTIISGEYKNRKKWAYDGIETKENLDYVKTRLARLKLNIPKKIKDLPEVLEAAIGLTCEIQVKTRGDFQNVYVNKLIDVDDADTGNAADDDWDAADRSKGRDKDDDREERRRGKDDDDDDKDRDDDKDDRRRSDDDDDRSSRSKSKDKDDDDDDDDDRDERRRSKDDDDDDDRGRSKEKDRGRSRDKDDDDDDDKGKRRKSKF